MQCVFVLFALLSDLFAMALGYLLLGSHFILIMFLVSLVFWDAADASGIFDKIYYLFLMLHVFSVFDFCMTLSQLVLKLLLFFST